MKMLVGLLSLALSFASVASTGETKTFTYDGTQNSVELILKGEKTHTEYRYEERRTTCYRTDIVGYRTVCRGGGYGGPRGPRPYPGRSCYRQPIYRQVAYPCSQTVQIPYEVKDFDVEARVIVDVTKLPEAVTTGETFKVTLHGDELSIATVGSKKFFLVLNHKDVRGTINGSVKFLDAIYAVELVEAAPVLKALNMTKITYTTKPVLSFDLGPVASRENLGFSLKVTHKRTLASDTVLFDRELAVNEVEVNAEGKGGVNFETLGIDLKDGKYEFTAKAFFKPKGDLMNRSQFGDDLETSRTLTYKIR